MGTGVHRGPARSPDGGVGPQEVGNALWLWGICP
jgi:hypothetical protein